MFIKSIICIWLPVPVTGKQKKPAAVAGMGKNVQVCEFQLETVDKPNFCLYNNHRKVFDEYRRLIMAGISNDKLRALDSAMRQIEKDFGKGSIIDRKSVV